MNETRFWSMIDAAWSDAGSLKKSRQALAGGKSSEKEFFAVMDALDEMIPALFEGLQELGREELLEFDRILERKLHELDRSELQKFTDGSDDGFLYARGFIVALGKSYYDAVNADPSLATMDSECEDICYLPYHVYAERFGEMPESGISRESRSNPAGWEKE